MYETDPFIDGDFTFLEKQASKRHSSNFNENLVSIDQKMQQLAFDDNYNNLQHFTAKTILKDTSNTRGLKLVIILTSFFIYFKRFKILK